MYIIIFVYFESVFQIWFFKYISTLQYETQHQKQTLTRNITHKYGDSHKMNTDITSTNAMRDNNVINNLCTATTDNIATYCLLLIIDGKEVIAEIDSRSCVNLMDKTLFQYFINSYDLTPECIDLHVSNGQHLKLTGRSLCCVWSIIRKYFHVVEEPLRHTLIERTGMQKLWPNWKQLFEAGLISNIQLEVSNNNLEVYQKDLVNKFADVF